MTSGDLVILTGWTKYPYGVGIVVSKTPDHEDIADYSVLVAGGVLHFTRGDLIDPFSEFEMSTRYNDDECW